MEAKQFIGILAFFGALSIIRELHALLMNRSTNNYIQLHVVARNGAYYIQCWSWLRWRDIRGADINKWFGVKRHHPKHEFLYLYESSAYGFIKELSEEILARNKREVSRTLRSYVIDVAEKKMTYKDYKDNE